MPSKSPFRDDSSLISIEVSFHLFQNIKQRSFLVLNLLLGYEDRSYCHCCCCSHGALSFSVVVTLVTAVAAVIIAVVVAVIVVVVAAVIVAVVAAVVVALVVAVVILVAYSFVENMKLLLMGNLPSLTS